ncbi:MAG: hypothetical protein IH921_09535 [Gemmatimonadetes bacterium]|nr:hypothetical protein [Gemmatimonadota bacterium]
MEILERHRRALMTTRKIVHHNNQHFREEFTQQGSQDIPRAFRPGQAVWLKKMVQDPRNRKLQPKWEKGEIVEQVSEMMYKVRRLEGGRKRTRKANILQIKPREADPPSDAEEDDHSDDDSAGDASEREDELEDDMEERSHSPTGDYSTWSSQQRRRADDRELQRLQQADTAAIDRHAGFNPWLWWEYSDDEWARLMRFYRRKQKRPRFHLTLTQRARARVPAQQQVQLPVPAHLHQPSPPPRGRPRTIEERARSGGRQQQLGFRIRKLSPFSSRQQQLRRLRKGPSPLAERYDQTGHRLPSPSPSPARQPVQPARPTGAVPKSPIKSTLKGQTTRQEEVNVPKQQREEEEEEEEEDGAFRLLPQPPRRARSSSPPAHLLQQRRPRSPLSQQSPSFGGTPTALMPSPPDEFSTPTGVSPTPFMTKLWADSEKKKKKKKQPRMLQQLEDFLPAGRSEQQQQQPTRRTRQEEREQQQQE